MGFRSGDSFGWGRVLQISWEEEEEMLGQQEALLMAAGPHQTLVSCGLMEA